MNPEKDALNFIEKLATDYFTSRDMAAMSERFDNDISWIGTGENEIGLRLREIESVLMQEKGEYNGSFTITNLRLEHICVSEPTVIAYGVVSTSPEDKSISDEISRFTAVVKMSDTGAKLLHLHFSHSDKLQEDGRLFVSRQAQTDNANLRLALDSRTRQLETLIRNIPGGAHQCANNDSLTLLSMSDGFLTLFGYSRQEIRDLFDDRYINMIYPGDRAQTLLKINEQLAQGRDIELEYRVLQKNGQPLWILDKGRLIVGSNGEPCFYCLLVDVNERKHEQEELRLSLERHRVIMDQATDIIFEWDIRKDTLSFSQNWVKKFGYEAINSNISGQIPLSKNIHPDDISIFVKLMHDTAAGVPYSETEFRICDYKKQYRWFRIRATAQYDENRRPIKAVGVIVDIDTEKRQKQALLEQAQLDALTGIYNKATINSLVERYMTSSTAQGFQALFIIDVDNFKSVNDTYGHLSGDSILSDVAAAIKSGIRSSDLAGRIGGDEFLLFLPDVSGEDTAFQKAVSLLKAFQTITPETGAPPISCSIGVAVVPHGTVSYQTLYKCADTALYSRKNNGRCGVTVYTDELQDGELKDQQRTEFDSETEDNSTDDKMSRYAFRTLYHSNDIEAAILRLLEIIGRSFGVNRAYIFENSRDGKYCSNTFEWCSDGVLPQIEKLQNLSYIEDLDDYQRNFDNNGLFYCADVRETSSNLRGVLEPQGIRSMLQCAMLDEGNFVGYVGFDECRTYKAWTPHQVTSFKLTADVLSTFLIKLRLHQMLSMQ